MKRFILTAVALSFLAVPMANAQSNQARQGYAQAQSFETAQNWNKQQKRIVKKRVVKKQIARKPVAQKRWARGQNVPAWQRKQVVRDYHRYGLRNPGHGQQWVRVGNDYLLISIFSGIIANLIVAR